MNGEKKYYSKAIGITYSPGKSEWVLTLAEKTPEGLRIQDSLSVSDAAKIESAIEKIIGTKAQPEQNPILIAVAADTAQTGFYPFTVPAMEGAMLDSLIATQAETILPMPLNQAAYTWKIIGQDSGIQNGYLAAVRRSYFQELMNLAPRMVGAVMPDAVSLAAAWSNLFESSDQKSILIQVRSHSSILALCENRELIRAAAVDFESASMMESLVHDIQGVLDVLDPSHTVPLYITGVQETAMALSRQLIVYGRTVNGWKISESKVEAAGLSNKMSSVTDKPEFYGTAMAALFEIPEFDFIRRPQVKSSESAPIDKKVLIRNLVLAAAMVLLLFAVRYWTSGRELQIIDEALAAPYKTAPASRAAEPNTAENKKPAAESRDRPDNNRDSARQNRGPERSSQQTLPAETAKSPDITGRQLLARQQMRERIARSRPDMLGLLTSLSIAAEKDIMLDSFTFKKGQPVRITAKAPSFERVYQFQKKLQEQPNVSDIKLISPTLDERRKQVQFSMTFAYGNFSR